MTPPDPLARLLLWGACGLFVVAALVVLASCTSVFQGARVGEQPYQVPGVEVDIDHHQPRPAHSAQRTAPGKGKASATPRTARSTGPAR